MPLPSPLPMPASNAAHTYVAAEPVRGRSPIAVPRVTIEPTPAALRPQRSITRPATGAIARSTAAAMLTMSPIASGSIPMRVPQSTTSRRRCSRTSCMQNAKTPAPRKMRRWRPSMRGTSSSMAAAEPPVSAPASSPAACPSGDAGGATIQTSDMVSTAAAAMARNTARKPSCSAPTPPSSGPSSRPTRCSAARPAMAFPRWRVATCSVMQASRASSHVPAPAPKASVARASTPGDADCAMTTAPAAIRPLPRSMPAL